MIAWFNRRSVYIGTDLKTFGTIRQLLAGNRIPYTYKVKNRMGQWAGTGTLRSRTGSFGQLNSPGEEYEVFVHKKDLEEAVHLLSKIQN